MGADRAPLTDYTDALDMVLAHAAQLGTESLPLRALHGRVLAEPVRTSHDMPFFDTSAMDGYALTAEDIEAANRLGSIELALVGTAAAGSDPTGVVLRPRQTLQILTGAAVPDGVAAIVMQEDVEVTSSTVRIAGPARAGQNIRARGEEFRSGHEVAPAGVLVTPGVVAAIAASGQPGATVCRQPRIGFLVTGDELVTPGEPLSPGCIYDANSFGVTASLMATGFEPPVTVHVPDDPGRTREALAELLDTCDVVITSGGVSVGELDAVKGALSALGVATVLWGVAIKPGKPFYFGRATSRTPGPAVFGLPGNPVAAMVTFHALVRPYLLRAIGLCGRPMVARARLAAGLNKKPGRMEFVPCRVFDGVANPVTKRGSHMLGTLTTTNALVLFPKDLATLDAGAEVEVMSLEGRVV